MIGSHYSVRFVQSRKEVPYITQEEFADVKRACHRWLMKNSPAYCREQLELPERKRMKEQDDDHNCITINDEKND